MRGGPKADWPWSVLGIAPTDDKNAIVQAYARQKADLPAAAPISVIAGLTEAREKALFIAAQQHKARSADSYDKSTRQDGGSAADRRAVPSDAASPGPALTGPPQPARGAAASVALSSPEPTSIHLPPLASRHLPSNQRTTTVVGLLVFCSIMLLAWLFLRYVENERVYIEEVGSARPSVDRIGLPDDPTTDFSRADMQALDRVVGDLFGADKTYQDLAQEQPFFARRLAADIKAYPEDPHAGRSLVRYWIMEQRDQLSREHALAASRLYLDWLIAAEAQGGEWCREVTGRSFFDGVPAVSEDVLTRERSLAWQLAQRDYAILYRESARPARLPDWARADASVSLGLPSAAIDKALSDETQPQRCAVTIALLRAMLARPQDVSARTLALL